MQTVTFATLDETEVENYAQFLAALMKEAYPGLNLNRGSVIFDLVLRKAAACHVYESTPLTVLQEQWNLAAQQALGDGADTVVVDQLLSNFNRPRTAGSNSLGTVQITLTSPVAMTITAGTLFTANSLQFAAVADQRAVLQLADKTSDADQVLVPANDVYSFTVAVRATAVGIDYNVQTGTQFTVSPRPTYFSEAKALGDFYGGSGVESNSEALARVSEGLTAKALSSPGNASAAVLAISPGGSVASIVGMIDPEMTRDQRGVLGISVGGRSDIYLRTQPMLDLVSVPVTTATLLDAGTNTYRIVLDRTQLAGAVKLVAVGTATTSVLELVNQTWGCDTSGLTRHPDVQSGPEAAFSCFQTLTVDFIDPSSAGSYVVQLYRMPGIAAVQNYCLDASNSDALADWLVRAPVPILVKLSLTIKAKPGVTIDTVAVQAAAAAAVNRHSFVSELNASAVVAAVHQILPTGSYVALPLDLFGELVRPDRNSMFLRSGLSLYVPADYVSGVSPRTAVFLTDAGSVSVGVEVVT